MHLTSPAQARAMEALIERGPMTLVFVYSTTCPHCHTYMPIWKRLCKQRQRRANMVSMEADVYQQTPMAAKKEVTGVPTVLFVDKEGRITEGEDIRNESMMNTAVSHGVSEAQINSGAVAPAKPAVADRVDTPYPTATLTADSSIFSPRASSNMSESRALSEPPTPGSSVSSNPLHVVPAQPVPSPQTGGAYQVGGNPWSAFLSAAVRQAAPAAVLLGAYGMLPRNSRSSGLGAPRRSRQTRKVNRRRRA
jgi:hypothetical protein